MDEVVRLLDFFFLQEIVFAVHQVSLIQQSYTKSMEENPKTAETQEKTQSQKVIEPSSQKSIDKTERPEAKIQGKSPQAKNETTQKVADTYKKQVEQEKVIRKMVAEVQPNITEQDIAKYIQYQKTKNRPIAKENFEKWQKKYNTKQEVKTQQPKNNQEPNKTEEPMKQQETKNVQEPKNVQQPKKAEEPKKVEQAKKVQQPKKIQYPKKAQQPKKGEQQKNAQEPNRLLELKKPEEPKKIDEPKKVQPPKEQTPQQICEQFFSNKDQTQLLQVKSKTLAIINSLVHSQLSINSNHIARYFKSEQKDHSFADFKQWVAVQHKKQAGSYVKLFSQSKSHSQMQNHFKRLSEILSKTNAQKSSLQINLGIGQNKGKSSIRGGISLANNKDEGFGLSLDIKIKKKLQLKSLIEGQIKKWQKQQSFHIFKLSKIEVTETEKGLKISLHSPIFQNQVCKDIINVINGLYDNGESPTLKVQGELTIKNSIRNDQAILHKKKFMKWLCDGFTSHLSIQGSTGVIQYFTSPISEFFPIFKLVRSGQINLKTKNITSVDKLFEKLGINEISEQTPTLHAFFAEILKENLSSDILPWVPELLKKCMHFASTIPNERISIDVNGHLSHLHFQLSIASEACKQLADIITTSTTELFS